MLCKVLQRAERALRLSVPGQLNYCVAPAMHLPCTCHAPARHVLAELEAVSETLQTRSYRERTAVSAVSAPFCTRVLSRAVSDSVCGTALIH
eukprot:IDg19826t1